MNAMDSPAHALLQTVKMEQAKDDDDDDLFDIVLPAVVRVFSRKKVKHEHKKYAGSVKGRRYIARDHQQGHDAIFRDYFAANCTYTDTTFQTRFRIPRELFLKLHDHFQSTGLLPQRQDATGRPGLSTLQKMTAALRMLAYGTPADAVDEYIRISGSSALAVLKEFCGAVVSLFAADYLRRPTSTDLRRIYKSNSELGFPGLIGSIDCTHISWLGCPKALHGQYKGKEGKPTVILEAVATHDLWLWHSFFGAPGTLNDINVLDQSDILDTLLFSSSPVNNILYTLNHKQRRRGYFLCDGIYPTSQVMARPVSTPQTEEEKFYTHMQESQRKDIERAFGSLKKRFGILACPVRLHKLSEVKTMVSTTIILHNMLVEASGRAISAQSPQETREHLTAFARIEDEMAIQMAALYAKEEASIFMKDLMKHVWDHKRGRK